MIPIPRYFRFHVWGVLLLGMLSTSLILWAVGMEYATTIFGWGIAMFWTSALLIEGAALGAERWLPVQFVSRRFCVVSLCFLGVALLSHFPVTYIGASIAGRGFSRWLEFTKPVYIEQNFGGSYDGYAKGALLFVAQWLLLLSCMLAIRKLFRSRKSNGGRLSAGFLALLVLCAFGTALPMLDLVDGIMKALGMSVTGALYLRTRLNVELAFVILTLVFCLQLWLFTAWVPIATVRRVMVVILPTLFVWVLPFVYGVMRFGVTSTQMVQMESIYVMVTLGIPSLSWVIFLVLERIKQTDSVNNAES